MENSKSVNNLAPVFDYLRLQELFFLSVEKDSLEKNMVSLLYGYSILDHIEDR